VSEDQSLRQQHKASVQNYAVYTAVNNSFWLWSGYKIQL